MVGPLADEVEARLYRRIRGNRARCDLCWRRCVIDDGDHGFCGTRRNINGTLFNLNYGRLSCLESRPIEIKPFFHYWPGSTAMTFSTWSCNFSCPWCQNHNISRKLPQIGGPTHTPEAVLEAARAAGDDGLCASFQEPTLAAEFASDLFKLARGTGLYSCFVSNGYMTPEALRLLAHSGMDGMNVDLKGPPEVYDRYCGGVSVWHVLRSARLARRLGIHVEVVNLLVTDVNDDAGSVRWIIDQHLKFLGEEVPLHFTRYHPAHKYTKHRTEARILEDAVEVARKEGVLFPYTGNLPGNRYENTTCPNCGSMVIRRFGYHVLRCNLEPGFQCQACHTPLPFVGRLCL